MTDNFDFDAQSDALHAMLEGKDEACIDCGDTHIQWASVINGVWLCTACSGKHRSLGTHLSFVRSLTLDRWKPEHLAMMRIAGGNAKLRKVFAEPEFASLDLVARYSHPLIVEYRNKLFDAAYASLGLDGPAERARRQADADKWRNAPPAAKSYSSPNAIPVPAKQPTCCGCF